METSKPPFAYTRSARTKALQDFAVNLTNALNSVVPSSDKPYRQVAVLAFHWENDDMKVDDLESELLGVFRQTYNFYTESFVIPVNLSDFSMNEKLTTWSKKWCGEGTLRIYVYSGHAGGSGTQSIAWWLAGCLSKQGTLSGPAIDWYRLRHHEALPGDLCYIFDCCSAASAAMHDGPETVAAAGWDQISSAILSRSFTRAFIDMLKQLNGETSTLANIYARLFRNAYASQIGASPVHVPRKGHPSITIAKLQDEKLKIPGQLAQQAQNRSQHRVLLRVSIRDELTEPNLEQWTKWLKTNILSGILDVDVKLEAAFQGSGVLLVSVPVAIWTMLPADDPTFHFVAHVNSTNILPGLTSNISAQLAIRPAPPSGRENQPFRHH